MQREAALELADARLGSGRSRWLNGHLLGTPGYSLPDVGSLVLPDAAAPLLRGPGASTATVLAAPAAGSPRLVVTLHESATDCFLLLGPGNPIGGEITIVGPRATVVLAGGPAHPSPIAATLWREDELLFIGAGTSANGLRIILHGGGRSVIIGEDCMFASNTVLRASDMHGIVDLRTGAQLECHGNILLEPHVWLGQDVSVLKNVRIGFGAIVAAKSLVNRNVPRFTLAAGMPARGVKQEVSWNRSDRPDGGLLARLSALASELTDPDMKSPSAAEATLVTFIAEEAPA